jgi:transcriptional antiterminator NusG
VAGISKWYVIHTYYGHENKVRDNIQKVVENRGMQDRILDVSVPTETVEETKEDGTVKEVERKTFPGYVFVKLSVEEDGGTYTMPDDAWYVIRNTRGVTGFVGPESKPVPLSEEEVAGLGVDHKTITINYEVGDYVRINDGPMKDFTGTVENIDVENNKTRVTVSMFGRETAVETELNQVERAVGD